MAPIVTVCADHPARNCWNFHTALFTAHKYATASNQLKVSCEPTFNNPFLTQSKTVEAVWFYLKNTTANIIIANDYMKGLQIYLNILFNVYHGYNNNTSLSYNCWWASRCDLMGSLWRNAYLMVRRVCSHVSHETHPQKQPLVNPTVWHTDEPWALWSETPA